VIAGALSGGRERGCLRARRWLAVGLVASALGVSACTDVGGSDQPSTTAATGVAPTSPVAFDPPSRFDLTRAVELTDIQCRQGTLHGTTLLWVEDNTVRSTDLAGLGRPWTTTLPSGQAQIYLEQPLVVGDVVVVVTVEGTDAAGPEYHPVINIVGLGIDDGTVLWNVPVPTGRGAAFDHSAYARLHERNGEVLVVFSMWVDRQTMILDPASGDVRLESDAETIHAVSGRYAFGERGTDMVSVDLETGETAPLRSTAMGRSYIDPADAAYIIIDLDHAETLLRFSSVDGTVETFERNPDDIRYSRDYRCLHGGDQPVLVCGTTSQPYSTVGADLASGEVVWTLDEQLGLKVAFHGNLYGEIGHGGIRATYAVFDQLTGEAMTRDIGLKSVDDEPVQVNEYGIMGFVMKSGDPLEGKFAWAPTSG